MIRRPGAFGLALLLVFFPPALANGDEEGHASRRRKPPADQRDQLDGASRRRAPADQKDDAGGDEGGSSRQGAHPAHRDDDSSRHGSSGHGSDKPSHHHARPAPATTTPVPPPAPPAPSPARAPASSWRLEAASTCSGTEIALAACDDLPECDTDSCHPVDCEFTDWSDWDACQCLGLQGRNRHVKHEKNECGKPCNGTMTETQECSITCNATSDCKWGDWEDWDLNGCVNRDDRGANKVRKRPITEAVNDGKGCSGASREIGRCREPVGAQDCKFSDWAVFTSCSTTCGPGVRSRHRRILEWPKHGGKSCDGSLKEINECSEKPCEKVDCDVSEWSDWAGYCSKLGNGQRLRERHLNGTGHDGAGQNGGETCNYTLKEADDCPQPKEGKLQDCDVSEWADWSACDKDCGNGQQYRIRKQLGKPKNGGDCELRSMNEMRGCRQKVCDVHPDCKLSKWSEWSNCTVECGFGTTSREREVLRHATKFGAGCEGNLSEVKPCVGEEGDTCEAVDCTLAEWSDWSGCDSPCGGGQKTRNRNVQNASSHGGEQCPLYHPEELEPCNTHDCKEIECVDGKWSKWSHWGDCSAGDCGIGYRSRTRHVVQEANYCGKALQGQDSHFKSCDAGTCDVDRDCKWDRWGNWSGCSGSCFGVRERARVVAEFARGMGKKCEGDSAQVESCNPGPKKKHPHEFERAPEGCEQVAPEVDCEYEDWGHWSDCTATCNGGVSKRGRGINYAKNKGRPCRLDTTSEVKPCNTHKCDTHCKDCRLSQWSKWSACTAGNLKTRDRHMDVYADDCGKPCPNGESRREVAGCTKDNDSEENLCWCAWGNWSDDGKCGRACGNTTKMQSRELSFFDTRPEDGEYLFVGRGKTCEEDAISMKRQMCHGTARQAVPCEWKKCGTCKPQDCVLSEWSGWNEEANGLCERSRHVKQEANECGKLCTEIGDSHCDADSCKVLDTKTCLKESEDTRCELGNWSDWSACDSDVDQSRRSRTVLEQPSGQNMSYACKDPLEETRACGSPPDAIDCVFEAWEDWEKCTASCDGGTRTRTRDIKQHPEHGGEMCDGALEELHSCGNDPCPHKKSKNCVLGDWADWGLCKIADGAHFPANSHYSDGTFADYVRDSEESAFMREDLSGYIKSKWRAVREDAQGKEGRGCDGPLLMVEECAPEPVDCSLADWSPWSHCSKSCGAGQRHRHRQVDHKPTFNGQGCSGNGTGTSELVSEPCHTQPCDVTQDCVLGDWGDWQKCSTSCGPGQQVQERTVKNESSGNGLACNGDTQVMRPCEHSHPCNHDQDCKWAHWSDWSACTCDCGGGQKKRTREISVSPRGGGKLCDAIPKQEIQPCKTQPCGTCLDAEWSDWTNWTSCSSECEGGMSSRTRLVRVEANSCGKPVEGIAEEYKVCNTFPCSGNADCEFSRWSDWSACTFQGGQTGAVVECDGIKSKSRGVKNRLEGDGEPCEGHTLYWHPCNQEGADCNKTWEQPTDCELSPWSSWGECSASCGVGQHRRDRQVANQPKNGGKPCDGDEGILAELKKCNVTACPGLKIPQDCVWGDWSDWGACTKCSGQQDRQRHIKVEAMYGGLPCEGVEAVITRGCGLASCAGFCNWDDWADWSQCSKTCGKGASKKRQRSLKLWAQPPLEDRLLGENEVLRERARTLVESRTGELAVAFAAGIGAVLSLFVASRAIAGRAAGRRPQRAEFSGMSPVSRTFVRQDLAEGLTQALPPDVEEYAE